MRARRFDGDACWDPSPGRGTGWHYPGSARPSSGPSHAVERVTSTVQSEQVPDPPHPARLGRCHHPGQYLAPALIRRTFKSTQAAGFSGGGRPSTLLLCSTRAASRPGGRPTLHSSAVHYYIVRNTHARWNLHDHVFWFHVFSAFPRLCRCRAVSFARLELHRLTVRPIDHLRRGCSSSWCLAALPRARASRGS